MASTDIKTAPQAYPPIHHMHWCQPTGTRTVVRIEQDIAYVDDANGRSVPAKRRTRCVECGESRLDDL